MRRLLVLAVCLAMATALGLSVTPAYAANTPGIGVSTPWRAPIGEKGGIDGPVAWCSRGTDPAVRIQFENINTGWAKVYQFRGTLPGYAFPRVDIGIYHVTTRATCGTTTRSKTESVHVYSKTTRTTISLEEYHKITRGMTRARVETIIGYDGRYVGSYNGKNTRLYENMAFFRFSYVSYRDGRVVGKMWNVPHD